MSVDVAQLLLDNPVLVTFLILGFGFLIGNLRIADVRVGSVTGVLLVSLYLGHRGLRADQPTQSVGFILFIYCVGIQAGPQFLDVFRQDGRRYFQLSLLIAILSAGLAFTLARTFDFAPGFDAGLLGGALTSTPTLVAAQDALRAGGNVLSGTSIETVASNISAGYAITYLFGVAGLILMVGFLPRLVGVDLEAEARRLGEERKLRRGLDAIDSIRPEEIPSVRAYRITNQDLAGRDRAELERLQPMGATAQKVKRGEEIRNAEDVEQLLVGDIVALVGNEAAHEKLRGLLGPEVLDPDVLERANESWSVTATSAAVAGIALHDLGITERYGCWLTKLTRSGIDMPLRPDLPVQLGDVLLLTGPRTQLEALAARLGYHEREVEETDLLTLAFGIAFGIAIGAVTLDFPNISLGLGSAGGVLVAGLLMGLLRSYRPTFGRVPAAARQVLMDLGLLLFMAQIGLSAGAAIVETFQEVGLDLMLCGVVVTTTPLAVGLLFARLVLRMNFALALGAITGAMTSTPALSVINEQARSSVPTLGYVGTYAFSNVFLALAGGLLMRL